MTIIENEDLFCLFLPHQGGPVRMMLDGEERAPLRQKLIDNFIASATQTSPLAGSRMLEEAIDEDPHLSQYRKAHLMEPVLFIPCADGVVAIGCLRAGVCEDHGHPLVTTSFTSAPGESLPPALKEFWGKVKDERLTIAQCAQTLQHTAMVLQPFAFHLLDQEETEEAIQKASKKATEV